MSLMKSVSGVRGIIGETLKPDIIVNLVSAFGQYISGKKIIVGGDSRVSGPFVKNIVKSSII